MRTMRGPCWGLAMATVAACLLILSPVFGAVGDLKIVARVPGADVCRSPALVTRDFRAAAPGRGATNARAAAASIWWGAWPLSLTVDSAKPGAEGLDVVRMTFSGAAKGGPTGAATLPLRRLANVGSSDDVSVYAFGPAVVRLSRGGAAFPVFAEGLYVRKTDAFSEVRLNIGVVAEGTCRFGGKTFGVRVIDADGRPGCNNAPPPSAQPAFSSCVGGAAENPDAVDVAWIDTRGGTFGADAVAVPLGQLAYVNGAWYRVAVSTDGAKITATPVAVKTGHILVAHDQWTMTLVGAKHVLTLRGNRKPVPVPVGHYVVSRYRQYAGSDAETPPAVLTVAAADLLGQAGPAIDVTAAKALRVAIGSPLVAKATVQDMGYAQQFGFRLVDVAGTAATITLPDGSGPLPPSVEVVDAAGKKIHSGQMEYG